MWKKELDAGETTKNYERALKRLKASKDICPSDKADFKRFITHMQANGVGKPRIIKYVNHLTVLCRLSGKPLTQLTKDDIEGLVGKISTSDYTQHTIHDYKVVIKRYYQWLRENKDGEYPPEVKWIKTAFKKRRLLPESLLTPDEFRSLVDAAENIRDKALILTDYDSGCRIGEILNLRINNVAFDKYGVTLIVDGKTGPRRVRMVNAVSALAQWLSIHPFREDGNAPLWVGMGTVGRYEPLKYHSARAIYQRLAKRTGIGKRIYSHLFRHMRATELANELTDAQMKEHLGWVQGSEMPSVYVHMSGKNLDAALLKASGIEIDESEKPQSILASRDCPRCRQRVLSGSAFCPSCGLAMSVSAVMRVEDERARYDGLMDKLMVDAEVRALLGRKIGELYGSPPPPPSS